MDALRLYGPPDEREVPVLFYLCLPVDLLRDPRLTKAQVAIAAALASHCDGQSYTCWPGNKLLGEMLAMSRRGIQTGIVALEAAGWIERRIQVGKRPARVVDLLWRRPEPKRKAHGRAPRGAPPCASKAHGDAPGIRSREPQPGTKLFVPKDQEEPKEPPTADQVAEWRRVEAEGGIMGRWATIALKMIARDFPGLIEP